MSVKIKKLFQDKYAWITIQKWMQNSFIKNISIVAGGSTIAQVISILFSLKYLLTFSSGYLLATN